MTDLPDSLLARLLAAPMRPGRLCWIGLRECRRGPVRTVVAADCLAGGGLTGDRYAGRGGRRGVTLIQQEHLPAIGAFLGARPPDPALLRRNLVVSGLNLLALRGELVAVGTALLEVTGPCAPCSRMEEALGTGGYQAMRGHGGVTARVVRGGRLRLGDAVARAFPPAPGEEAG